MNGWRVGYAVGLLAFIVPPLAIPFTGALKSAAWEWNADDAARLLHLGVNTLLLTTSTLALALPLGIILAALLFRTEFLGRGFLVFLSAVCLLVPLPVLVSSWQALLGGSRPWATGLAPAIWIHAVAATPWVAFIVGLGLSWVEPELEDEAAQSVDPWRVLALVSLPRARASILAAALFVVLQTAAEVSVTEMLLVPTLAEEARSQFARNDTAGLERTLLLALPGLLAVWLAVLGVLAYLERRLPPPAPGFRAQPLLEIGGTWMRMALASALLACLITPLFSLVWRLGLAGHPGRWTSNTAWRFLEAQSVVRGGDLIATLGTSLTGGFLTAGLALLGCWLARDSRWFRWLLFSVLAWAWVMPGSVLGIGLHGLIQALPGGPWKMALYYGPSPAPLIWVQTLRALPIAVVFLWPIVRMIPRAWFEEARLGGAGSVSEFLHVVAPMTWRATLLTALASSAMCLGEVAGSARVETPGWQSFAVTLQNSMHTGVDNAHSALSLLMLGCVVTLAIALGVAWRVVRLGC